MLASSTNLSKTVRGYSDANKRIYTDYMRQCGIGSDVEVNVHVETTTTE